jgi:hypothetical protein
MAINTDRPIITYENIALFQSDTPAHSVASNSGQNLSFLPLVQSINFSVDIPRTNAGALGTKGFIDQSNRNAPDVQFSVNTIEDFGDLFTGLFSGHNVRDNLNIDRNFYAVIGNERGFDVSGENLSGRDVLSFGNCFLNNVSISQSINGLINSQYSYVGSNLEAQKIDTLVTSTSPAVVADEDVTGFKVSGVDASTSAGGDDGAEDESGVFASGGIFNGKTLWSSSFNGHIIRYSNPNWIYLDTDLNPAYSSSTSDFPWNATWTVFQAAAGTSPQFYDFNGGVTTNILATGLRSPSINLTGDQSQNISGVFSSMDSYYNNESSKIIPHYSTNVTISADGSTGNFLIKSDSIQGFDLGLPINRKTIYSLGKKYPIKRKALFPSEGSFNFSNRVSNFEVSGDRSNLKDFLNSDESYTLDISGQDKGSNSFHFQIAGAKLSSQNYSSSIGSDIVADLGFSFELNKFQNPVPAVTVIPFKIKGDTSSAVDVTMNGVTERFTDAAQFVSHSEGFTDTSPVTITFDCVDDDGRFNGGNCVIVGGSTNFNPLDETNAASIDVTWNGTSSEVTIDLDVFID